MLKTKVLTIPKPSASERENRDAGKAFLITEMPAMRAEKWAARALMAVAASGLDIPGDVLRMGAPALVAVGFRSLLATSFAEAEPLLDEMMGCVEFIPDRSKPNVTRSLDVDDIEEVTTLLTLRSEIVEIHVGFSPAAFLSTLGRAAKKPAATSETTPTSPAASES